MELPVKKDMILSKEDWKKMEHHINEASAIGRKAKPFDRTTIPEGQSHLVLILGNYFYHKED